MDLTAAWKTLLNVLLSLFPILCYSSSVEWNEISKILSPYTRPITFLGIAEEDIVSSLASQYDGVFVLLNPEESTSRQQNLIHLRTVGTKDILRKLGEAEHFDVAFVRNHGKNPYNTAYARSLYTLSEHVLVAIDEKSKPLVPYLLAQKFQEIYTGQSDLRLFFANHTISYLRRTTLLEPINDKNYVRHIHSTYCSKTQTKNFGPIPVVSIWLPGINLTTFKLLQGALPHPEQLEKEIKRLYDVPHPDWMPNNIIVQGEALRLIDFDHPPGAPHKTIHDKTMLSLMITFVREQNPQKIPIIREQLLAYCRFMLHGNLKSLFNTILKEPNACALINSPYAQKTENHFGIYSKQFLMENLLGIL